MSNCVYIWSNNNWKKSEIRSNWIDVQLKLSMKMCDSNLNNSLVFYSIEYMHVAIILSILRVMVIDFEDHLTFTNYTE